MRSNGPVERLGINPMLVAGPSGQAFEVVDLPLEGGAMERKGPGKECRSTALWCTPADHACGRP
jgi:hypothetical protein